MSAKTIQLELPLLLPEIEDARDACVERLQERLRHRRGIERVHIRATADPPQLCLHYDPNLVTLAAVERMARDAGSALTAQFRHERIPFRGMDAADAAEGLARELQALPGMLHARVNYAAGIAFVAYETARLARAEIERAMRALGYEPLAAPAEPGAMHEEGAGPSFLPAWMRDRWRIILVALAGLFLLLGWAGSRFWGFSEEATVALFLLSYVAGGYDIAGHAIPGLLRGRFDTDVLMLAAALGAALLGEWAEGAFLLFLFSLGHAGEHYALDRARHAVNALGELMPVTARVKQGSAIVEKPVAELMRGDIVVVPPGERLAADGRILQGASAIDQSAITGESVPVSKQAGDGVFAGTINQENALEVEVTRLAQDTTLNRIVQMVAEAQQQQSPTQQLTQRFTAVFVPAVLVLVALVIAVPPLAGWMPMEESFYRAMLLLVAASPCALALGTPAAVLAGIAQAARNGVLIKGGVHLENLGELRAMAFDKTGTLTQGEFQLTDIVPLNGTPPQELLRTAAAVEQQSSHPLAQAIVQAAEERELVLPAAANLQNMPGLGVRSAVEGQPVLVGSAALFAEADGYAGHAAMQEAIAELGEAGKTTVAVGRGTAFMGVLALADVPRPGTRQTLQALRDLGLRHLIMLTGDQAPVARAVAQEVGIDDVRAGLLPEQKLEAIRSLGQEYGQIAMTGDGVNDAPALAAATVGVAMGGAGTAVALETADVALMADDLSRLPFAVGLSRASRAIIRQNLALSLGVIALLILTAVAGVVQLSGAVVLHEGSTILVVLNALRLLRYR